MIRFNKQRDAEGGVPYNGNGDAFL